MTNAANSTSFVLASCTPLIDFTVVSFLPARDNPKRIYRFSEKRTSLPAIARNKLATDSHTDSYTMHTERT